MGGGRPKQPLSIFRHHQRRWIHRTKGKGVDLNGEWLPPTHFYHRITISIFFFFVFLFFFFFLLLLESGGNGEGGVPQLWNARGEVMGPPPPPLLPRRHIRRRKEGKGSESTGSYRPQPWRWGDLQVVHRRKEYGRGGRDRTRNRWIAMISFPCPPFLFSPLPMVYGVACVILVVAVWRWGAMATSGKHQPHALYFDTPVGIQTYRSCYFGTP